MNRIIPILLLLCMSSLRAAEVSASLSTDSVAAGQGALLTLNITGGEPTAQPEIPPVKDFIINTRGTSKNIRIINGEMTRSLSFTYVVGSPKEGDYEVPAIRVMVDGKVYFTKPLALRVRAAADARPQGMGEEDEEDGVAEEPGAYGRLALLMVKKDRKNLYPGEIAPVRIRAYFPADARVSLKGAPRPEGSAFTLHNLSDKPEQSSEVIDGKRYLVVTWFGGLSATKAGKYPATIKLDGTVAVRDQSAARRPSAFNDPFFRRSMLDDFFAPMIEKDIELTTDDKDAEIEVTELPQAGRPESFTGAIGKFEFESASVPSSLRTGEPFRIEAVLKGEGNFSLLSEPKPTPADEWKIYSGKDNFEGGDVASFAGRKAFRYSAVPLVPGDKEVTLEFSYFDPDTAKYVEVNSTPQRVNIAGEVISSPRLGEEAQPSEEAPGVPQLAPLASHPGAVKSYAPLTDRAWFVPLLASCGLLSLGILGFGWWKVRAEDPAKLSRQELDRATQVALANAGEAAGAGNAVAFFNAARNAVRLRIAEARGINPEAVTAADLDGVEDETVAGIFREADRVEYSGRSYGTEDLTGWNMKLDAAMAALQVGRKTI